MMNRGRILRRLGQGTVGVLAVYTGYTSYVYYATRGAIRDRRGSDEPSVEFASLMIHGRYENPFVEYRPQTVYEFLVMRLIEFSRFEGASRGGVPSDVGTVKESLGWRKVGNVELDVVDEEVRRCSGDDGVGYTWLGQSCGILHAGSRRFLMDPMFASWMIDEKFGPQRIVPSPVDDVKGLDVDYVLVSHDHPDHLDYGSVQDLGGSEYVKKWIVPVGLGCKLTKNGVREEQVIELDWWESTVVDDEFEVVCLPAMHWSGQHVTDTNASLWCSFLVRRHGESIFYHGGDTGYVERLFSGIAEKYGPVKMAALPVGQYCPEWHQRPRHISPSESLRIVEEMKVGKMVAVHWGTWVLSSESYLEPREKLIGDAEKNGVTEKVIVPGHGESVVVN